MKCITCDHDVTPLCRDARDDLVLCPKCWNKTPTGKEPAIREDLESHWTDGYPYVAGGRAVYYSYKIYSRANTGKSINYDEVEDVLVRRKSARRATVVSEMTVGGRSYSGSVDPGVGCIILGLNDGLHRYIYVIFRGSVGMRKNDRNKGAGRDLFNPKINVDWRVNFDNKMVRPKWAGGSIKVHRGFHEVYDSYQKKIITRIGILQAQLPGAQVIITGHSQGAAHAILCAHHLAYIQPTLATICLPFSSPRVGNLEFARDFNSKIADHVAYFPSDLNDFPRCIVAVQKDDLVPKGQKHAFKGHITGRVHKVADGVGIIAKGIFSNTRKEEETEIYYHVKHFYKAAQFGMHIPKALSWSILKR